jgi:hypothetical protein
MQTAGSCDLEFVASYENSLCPLWGFIRNKQSIPNFGSISGEQEGSRLPRFRRGFIFVA